MRSDRFVLDANIWISYFISERVEVLLHIIYENEITVYSCDELLEELKRVLDYGHLKKYKADVKEALRIFKEATCHFEISHPFKDYIPEDPDDNYVIALALQSNSGFVASGDKHILNAKKRLEKKYSKLRVLTKAELEKMFV